MISARRGWKIQKCADVCVEGFGIAVAKQLPRRGIERSHKAPLIHSQDSIGGVVEDGLGTSFCFRGGAIGRQGVQVFAPLRKRPDTTVRLKVE